MKENEEMIKEISRLLEDFRSGYKNTLPFQLDISRERADEISEMSEKIVLKYDNYFELYQYVIENSKTQEEICFYVHCVKNEIDRVK